jgi:hypothetical protein
VIDTSDDIETGVMVSINLSFFPGQPTVQEKNKYMRPRKYQTEEERKEAIREQKRAWNRAHSVYYREKKREQRRNSKGARVKNELAKKVAATVDSTSALAMFPVVNEPTVVKLTTSPTVNEIGLVPNHLSKGVGEARTLQRLLQRGRVETFDENYIMHGVNESVVSQLSKGVFSEAQLRTLLESTKELEKRYPPKNGGRKRGDNRVHHIGYWRKRTKEICQTKSTRNHHVQQWISRNRESGFFAAVETYVKETMPSLYHAYNSIILPNGQEKLFPPFNAVAINFNIRSLPHFDEKDPAFGHAFIIPFGDYIGGDLVLETIHTAFVVRPGDIAHFAARGIKHWNREYTGERYSLVFFTDATSFFT